MMDITLTSSKRHPIGTPEERNQPPRDVFNFLIFGPMNPSKGQASCKPSQRFKLHVLQGGVILIVISTKLRHTHLCFSTTDAFNMDFPKGAGIYEEEYHNRFDDSFSDKSHGSKTTNSSSLATAVSDTVNATVVELVAGSYHTRSKARKYDNHW
jgi:hypothetical protein